MILNQIWERKMSEKKIGLNVGQMVPAERVQVITVRIDRGERPILQYCQYCGQYSYVAVFLEIVVRTII